MLVRNPKGHYPTGYFFDYLVSAKPTLQIKMFFCLGEFATDLWYSDGESVFFKAYPYEAWQKFDAINPPKIVAKSRWKTFLNYFR